MPFHMLAHWNADVTKNTSIPLAQVFKETL